MLKIKKLSKSFNEIKFLYDINFNLHEGEIAVLIGPSGIGKSTFLRILNNLEQFDSGLMIYNNEIVTPEILNKNKTISMVFQNPSLFKYRTAIENLTLVLEKVLNLSKNDSLIEANNLLKTFELENVANKYISHLSGGQQQRLAFARALTIKSKVLCLDEPTSALDPILTNCIARHIQKLASLGHSFIITTHDMYFLNSLNCTIHLMNAGSIVSSTSSEEFNKNPDKYKLIKDFIQ
jgi:polar amino acid transport system ATP-binding protein